MTTYAERGRDMNKIVDTLVVAAMLLTSVPSLADDAVTLDDPGQVRQETREETPEKNPGEKAGQSVLKEIP